MKVKIEIKNRWTGKVLFAFESENNTVKDTVLEAVKQGADLSGASIRGASLIGASLIGASLIGADLSGADLRGASLIGASLIGASLIGASLIGADLSGADLRGASLSGADIRGANLSGNKIKKAVVFTGLYAYVVVPYITDKDEQRVKMGCHDRSVAEWEVDFWNNPNEFQNNGSEKSQLRLMAYNTAKAWLEIATKTLS